MQIQLELSCDRELPEYVPVLLLKPETLHLLSHFIKVMLQLLWILFISRLKPTSAISRGPAG
ncbi:MAG: hypothetical protein GDA48_27100 [Hormoscilla sp. GM102CHS1]|nr:hypothetical protein [Hormoscilla sp. GM102CHS1]